MRPRRHKPLLYAVVALVATWVAAYSGFALARHSRMTVEKVRAYAEETDLARLQGEARLKAIRGLADRLNGLSPDERRRARHGRLWDDWFDKMSETEKGLFIEWTAPTGFKHMLTAF